MVKKCIYCGIELQQDSVVDICQKCMYKVWGPKMAEAIVSGMEEEKAKGNMELGRVSESKKDIVIGNKIIEDLSFESEIVEQLPEKNLF